MPFAGSVPGEALEGSPAPKVPVPYVTTRPTPDRERGAFRNRRLLSPEGRTDEGTSCVSRYGAVGNKPEISLGSPFAPRRASPGNHILLVPGSIPAQGLTADRQSMARDEAR